MTVMDSDAVSFLSATEVAVTVAVPFPGAAPLGFVFDFALTINPLAGALNTTELDVCPLKEPLPVEPQVTPLWCPSWVKAAWMVRD